MLVSSLAITVRVMVSHTHHVPHVRCSSLAPGGPEFALMVQTPDRCQPVFVPKDSTDWSAVVIKAVPCTA